MLIKRFVFAVMALVIMTSAGCGFKLQGSYSIPAQLHNLTLDSQDQYSELTRLVSERLRLNSVNIEQNNNKLPVLNLLDDSLQRATLSLYPTGNVAEYELIYQVNFTVTLPKQEAQSFSVEIRRDYLDDPRTALAKSREMELLLHEMRIQAADAIVRKLASIEIN